MAEPALAVRLDGLVGGDAVLEPHTETLVEKRNVLLGERVAQDLGLFGPGRQGQESVGARDLVVVEGEDVPAKALVGIGKASDALFVVILEENVALFCSRFEALGGTLIRLLKHDRAQGMGIIDKAVWGQN